MKKTRRQDGERPAAERARLPVLCGADIELGNFVLGRSREDGTGAQASRALLREIEGLPRRERDTSPACDCAMCRGEEGGARGMGPSEDGAGDDRGPADGAIRKSRPRVFNPQDWGRKFLPANGGCAYIDLDHLELCLPEVLSAHDHVACWHAMLRIARGAMARANEGLPPGRKVQVLVNNTDGRGNSYGSHLDFLITRRAWDNIFLRKIHYMLYLAAFQVSAVVFSGQGKVGGENGAEPVAFQLSQRADFFETLMGPQTTFNRPVVNSRDEPLCGSRMSRAGVSNETDGMARLHVIFFDNTLCHVASLLKVGVMQIVLAMIEAERVDVGLILDDPVEALGRWSHDPTLRARARLTSGSEVTAVELQLMFLEGAKRFVGEGGCEGVVPRAEEILALWEDTLLKLAAGDFAALAPRLDWVLKLSVLRQVLRQRPNLTWASPQLKHLDHMYSSLDPEEGLYWAYERSGFVERVADDERVEHFVGNPPDDTRAWTRAALMRIVDPEAVDEVNWDFIRFKLKDGGGRTVTRTLDMASPLGMTRAAAERLFQESDGLAQLLDALGAPPAQSTALKPRAAGVFGGNGGARASASTIAANRQLAPWRGVPGGAGRLFQSPTDDGQVFEDEVGDVKVGDDEVDKGEIETDDD